MKTIDALEAKNRLSELLDAADNGEEFVISKHGRPVAKLSPVEATLSPRREFDRAKAREAIEWLKEFRKSHPLRGLLIKDLINEGRKY
jgi:prevent-host-death family protein